MSIVESFHPCLSLTFVDEDLCVKSYTLGVAMETMHCLCGPVGDAAPCTLIPITVDKNLAGRLLLCLILWLLLLHCGSLTGEASRSCYSGDRRSEAEFQFVLVGSSPSLLE